MELRKEFGSLSNFFWKFTAHKQIVHDRAAEDACITENEIRCVCVCGSSCY